MNSILLCLFMWITVVSCGERGNEISVKPNIVFILADDLGYGEVGYQGQKKINTPLIDTLARSGKIFTNHYTAAPKCAQAWFTSLIDKNGGHAYIRGNDEWRERGEI